MVLTKDKNSLGILITTLVILPFSIIFLLLSYGVFRSLKNKMVVSDSDLLVEDFSRMEFPWRVIRGVSTKSQSLPRGGEILWLVLHTTCGDDYSSPKT